jgi:hypothetical protein
MLRRQSDKHAGNGDGYADSDRVTFPDCDPYGDIGGLTDGEQYVFGLP